MRWMITDSGLGGLSVCAGLERYLKQYDLGQGIELLYVNATPDDLIGYNALKTQKERIALFDQFLRATTNRFSPDKIAIACNTLSVIYNDTAFARSTDIDVKGIVGAGVSLIDTHLEERPDHKLIIYATETTTEAGTYPRLITANAEEVSAQECPELAHAISIDASGGAARERLKGYVTQSIEYFDTKPSEVFAFLGCTHYGYQATLFSDLLEEHGCQCTILNPNDLLVEQLISNLEKSDRLREDPLTVKFVSRYQIPEDQVASMEHYLEESAPQTLAALRAQTVEPELFNTP